MTKNEHLPPQIHRVRGLRLNELNQEKQNVVKKIANIVKRSAGRLDMQIRDGYVNVYYRGGCIWKVSRITPKSRSIIIETDTQYFGKKSRKKKAEVPQWLPKPQDSIDDWDKVREKHQKIMDKWIAANHNDEDEGERELQQRLTCEHLKNPNSKWIILDIEYAAWLHDSKKNKEDDRRGGRRLCRYDMIGIKRRSLQDDGPIPVYIMELKVGAGAIGGKSGIISHAEDIAQLLNDKRDEKALRAFKDSVQNIIREKIELEILPGVSEENAKRDIEPRVAFIMHESGEMGQVEKDVQETLSGCCEKILWKKAEDMLGEKSIHE
ncbi:MAG: hypothetical protein OEY01_12815 [Desulfobulbaceae bacterium]|nr:hypothetical protein [Desulfobulbaceae bacterium]